MAEDDASKTEDPTAKKLSKGREEGTVAMSMEIKSWMILLGSAFAVGLFAPWMMRGVSHVGSTFIFEPHAIPMDFEHLRLLFSDLFIRLGILLAPVMALLFFLAIFASVGQTGFMYSPKKLKPKLSKFSPKQGIKKIVSVKSFIEFVKGIFKLSIVTAVAFSLAVPLLDDIQLIPSFELPYTLDRMHDIAIILISATVAVMTAIAALDYMYQRYAFIKQMKMTKQEVKDEHKQSEGDPMVKSRIRRLRHERAMQRMMAAVPRADVVITNPTHYAVALEYKMEVMPSPKLIAKGIDELAHRIRDVAEENDIPVVENPPLARALYAAVDLDEEIPAEHYKAVAEVIGYVMRLKGKLPPQ